MFSGKSLFKWRQQALWGKGTFQSKWLALAFALPACWGWGRAGGGEAGAQQQKATALLSPSLYVLSLLSLSPHHNSFTLLPGPLNPSNSPCVLPTHCGPVITRRALALWLIIEQGVVNYSLLTLGGGIVIVNSVRSDKQAPRTTTTTDIIYVGLGALSLPRYCITLDILYLPTTYYPVTYLPRQTVDDKQACATPNGAVSQPSPCP